MMRTASAALAAAVLFLGGHQVLAQTAPAAQAADDALTNPAYRRAEVLAFMGVRPGWRVADIVAGRFTRALSQAVGPAGRVYAFEPAEVVKVHPAALTLQKALASSAGYENVEVLTGPVNAMALPPGLDAVFIRQNYHDLHDPFMGPADIGAFNRAVFAALKPGGVYVVLDHAAAAGSGLRDTNTLHRIDAAAVKMEAMAAGFVLDGESAALANGEDAHAKNVFDPSLRGHTDQFLLKFRKPG